MEAKKRGVQRAQSGGRSGLAEHSAASSCSAFCHLLDLLGVHALNSAKKIVAENEHDPVASPPPSCKDMDLLLRFESQITGARLKWTCGRDIEVKKERGLMELEKQAVHGLFDCKNHAEVK